MHKCINPLPSLNSASTVYSHSVVDGHFEYTNVCKPASHTANLWILNTCTKHYITCVFGVKDVPDWSTSGWARRLPSCRSYPCVQWNNGRKSWRKQGQTLPCRDPVALGYFPASWRSDLCWKPKARSPFRLLFEPSPTVSNVIAAATL